MRRTLFPSSTLPLFPFQCYQKQFLICCFFFLFTFFFLLFLLLLSSTLPFLCFLSLGVNSTRFVPIKNQDYILWNNFTNIHWCLSIFFSYLPFLFHFFRRLFLISFRILFTIIIFLLVMLLYICLFLKGVF